MTTKGWISSHVLDTASGRPGNYRKNYFFTKKKENIFLITKITQTTAQGIDVSLFHSKTDGGAFKKVAKSATDNDGRVKTLYAGIEAGVYKCTFDLRSYYRKKGGSSFYPEATICFVVQDASEHFHIPLLLSPYGYTTYRGS